MDTNEQYYSIRCASVGFVTLFVTGNVFQTFMVSYGVSMEQVSHIVALLGLVQMAATLFMSLVADLLKRVKRSCVMVTGLLGVYYIILAPLMMTEVAPETLAWVALAAGALQCTLIGVYAILEFKLPYVIIDMRNYARLSAISGLFISVAQVCAASLAAYLLAHFQTGKAMAGLFAGCIVLVVLATLLTAKLRENGTGQTTPLQGGLSRVLQMRAFKALLVPNLMRGVNSGIVNMLVIIGMHELGLTVEYGASMAIVYTVMSIVGAFQFGWLSKHIPSRKLCLLAGFVVLALLPNLLLTDGGMAFMVGYAVLLDAVFMVDYTVPVIVTEIVPYDCIGGYSSLRLGAHWAGISLSSGMVGVCLERGGIHWLLIISATMQLLSGLIYYMFSKKHSFCEKVSPPT